MTRAHVGLGSNLGDRMAILDTAVRVLDADERTHVMAVPRHYFLSRRRARAGPLPQRGGRAGDRPQPP